MIENFSEFVDSLETVQVIESEQDGDRFSLSLKIDEDDLGWIALEAIARFCASHDFLLSARASQKSGSLGFAVAGRVQDIAPAMPELHELVFPSECTYEQLST